MNRTTPLPDRRPVRDRKGAAATAAPPPAHAAHWRRRPTSQQWAAWAFLAPVTVYLVLFYAYPLYRNLDLSLRNYTVRSFVQGNAPFTGLDNYQDVFDDPTFGPALIHTVVFTVVCLVFQYAIGLALAVFFHQHFRLSATLRALFLVPWLLPLIVSASTWSWMLNSDAGVVNAALQAVGIGSARGSASRRLRVCSAGPVSKGTSPSPTPHRTPSACAAKDSACASTRRRTP